MHPPALHWYLRYWYLQRLAGQEIQSRLQWKDLRISCNMHRRIEVSRSVCGERMTSCSYVMQHVCAMSGRTRGSCSKHFIVSPLSLTTSSARMQWNGGWGNRIVADEKCSPHMSLYWWHYYATLLNIVALLLLCFFFWSTSNNKCCELYYVGLSMLLF